MPALKNIRHEKAVQAFLSNGGNKSAAYREVYKGSVKWSEGVVWRRASELFNRGDVSGRVKEVQKQLADKEIVSKENILKDLKSIGTVTIKDYIEKFNKTTGEITWKDPADWTKEMEIACTGMKPTRNGVELSIYGIVCAYEKITKLMGYDAPIKMETKDTTLADLLKT